MNLLSENTMKPRSQAFCYLSRHAFERLSERTQLTPDLLMALLDQGAVVNIGRETATDREHLLFYSLDDRCCFVAIQDRLRGEVVTVLPLDYHKNLAWPVTDAQQAEAVTRAQNFAIARENDAFNSFELRAHYICPAEQRIKTTGLGKIAKSAQHAKLHQVLSSPELETTIQKTLIGKAIKWSDVVEVSIRAGKRGTPVFMHARQFNLATLTQ